jgi:hypothetical protein
MGFVIVVEMFCYKKSGSMIKITAKFDDFEVADSKEI